MIPFPSKNSDVIQVPWPTLPLWLTPVGTNQKGKVFAAAFQAAESQKKIDWRRCLLIGTSRASGSSSGLQMLPEKIQRYRPGFLGGIWVIAFRIIVGMKSVLSTRIDLISVGLVVFLH